MEIKYKKEKQQEPYFSTQIMQHTENEFQQFIHFLSKIVKASIVVKKINYTLQSTFNVPFKQATYDQWSKTLRL